MPLTKHLPFHQNKCQNNRLQKWAVLENNRSLWTKEEKANGYSDIDSHWPLYPEYDGSFDDYESIVLDQTSYFEEVMDLITQEELLYKAEVCFALYVFFVQSK